MTIDPRTRCTHCLELKTHSGSCVLCGVDDSEPEETISALPRGTVLNDRYLMGRLLGSGGFANTYLALDLMLGTKLAIKEYLPVGLASRRPGQTDVLVVSGDGRTQYQHGLEKYLEEAQTLARFNGHPGIVSIHDFFHANQTAYIVMEYLDGFSLKEFLQRKGGRLTLAETLEIMTPVMDALRAVHGAGVLHRDISPDNIIIKKSKQVKLIDFGAARFALGDVSKSLSVILKPGYAPAEQYFTSGKQGPWTDLYAVAATIYYVLTGVLPPEAVARMEEDRLQVPSALGAVMPAEMESALLKALAVRSAERWQDMAGFQQVFGGIDRPETHSRQESQSRQPFFKNKKGILAALLFLLVIITAILIYSLSPTDNLRTTKNSSKGSATQTDNEAEKLPSTDLKQTTVPDLNSYSKTDLERILAQASLTLGKLTYAWDESAIKDSVLSQSVPAGRPLSRGSVIDVLLSKGPIPYGNSFGNLMNGGTVAEDETAEYTAIYTNTWNYMYTASIYRIDKASNKRTKLVFFEHKRISYLNVVGEHLYFITDDYSLINADDYLPYSNAGFSIYKLNKRKGNPVKLATFEYIDHLTAVGDELYFLTRINQNSSQYLIKTMKLATGKITTITKFNLPSIVYRGAIMFKSNKMYYDCSALCTYDLVTSKFEKINDFDFDSISAFGDEIFLMKHNKGLYKLDNNNQVTDVFLSKTFSGFQIQSGRLIIAESEAPLSDDAYAEEKGRISVIENGQLKHRFDGYIRISELYTTSKKLYFREQVVSEGLAPMLYRMNVDGNNKETIIGE